MQFEREEMGDGNEGKCNRLKGQVKGALRHMLFPQLSGALTVPIPVSIQSQCAFGGFCCAIQQAVKQEAIQYTKMRR